MICIKIFNNSKCLKEAAVKDKELVSENPGSNSR